MRPCANSGDRILLVEDEAVGRELVYSILTRRGYEVVASDSPHSALVRTANARGRNFDLVLTDIQMLGMDGVQLAEQIRNSRPGLPVLFMSGHSEYFDRPCEILRSLAKPLAADELVRSVENALCED
jgi:CheY-like chemotaxis protein